MHKDVWKEGQGCTFKYTILELFIGTLKTDKLYSVHLPHYDSTHRDLHKLGPDKILAWRGGVGTKYYP